MLADAQLRPGKVVRESIGSGSTAKVLDYVYDESGRPSSLIFTDGTAEPVTYYYVLNLQGDVEKIIDADGTVKAQYSYDPWGKILSITDGNGTTVTDTHIARLNSLRYRGYCGDTETQWYYLQSRYYDPLTRRFVNADSITYTGQGFIGTNMFAYCNNNPACMIDLNGHLSSYIDDTDCNGIPDYLEIRWYIQTKNYKKKVAIENGNLRDVTEEVDSALVVACIEGAKSFYEVAPCGAVGRAASYKKFYDMVNHGERWDIKIGQRWKETIGTDFPGEDIYVMYRGNAMTPEDIGNYTYGCIGKHFGFKISIVLFGSYHAAGYPKYGIDLWNEARDWYYITEGYYSR